MPQGQKTSTDIQWVIMHLSKFLDHERIAMCLNISTRMVQRVLSQFHVTGTIPNEKVDKEVVKRVRNKHLRDIDVEVSILYLLCCRCLKPRLPAPTVSSGYCTEDPGFIPR